MLGFLPDISPAAWSAGAATVAAVTAVASWWLNLHRGAVSARIAKADDADRQWNALIPQFDVRFTVKEGDRAELRVRLDGPLGLERLDRVTVSIRDDIPDRGSLTRPGGPSREQIKGQVWGPFRLNPQVENTDPTGRTVEHPNGLDVGEEIVCALEQTLMPPWSESRTPDWWQEQYRGKPVRLTIAGEKDGHRPWRIPKEVPTPVASRVY